MTRSGSLPNLLIPGAPKGGTSSLAWYLIQHPEICPGDRKEIDYFSPLCYGRPIRASLDDYAAHFADCAAQAYRLDASVGYFHGGRDIVEAIAEVLPDAKVVIILRNPVDRLFSSYRSKKDRRKIDGSMSFRDFFEISSTVHAHGQDRVPPHSRYASVGIGRYAEITQHWLDVFGDKVHVTFFEHLASDPAGVVEDVCERLGLDTAPVKHFDYAVRNVTVDPRSRTLSYVARRANLRVDRHFRRYPRVKQLVRRVYTSVNGRKRREHMSAEDRAMVAGYYESANRDLYRQLMAHGITRLPGWLVAHKESVQR